MTANGLANPRPTPRRNTGVLSVETAFNVLRPLIDARDAQPLSALAEASGVPAAKAHRYLVSLIRAGMVAQDPASGRYDLGPLALQLGLASLDRFDPVRYAASAAARLRDEIGETVSIVVWGNAGPTVIRTEHSPHEVTLTMRVGTVLPPATSACGILFLAYQPSSDSALGAKKRSKLRGDAKRRGLTRTVGGVLAGVSALAAPIFTSEESIAGVVTAYGRSGSFDATWDGRIATALRRFAADLSSVRRRHAE